MVLPKTYSLSELAKEVGIEARTIRSYFTQGLLRGADRPGPKASYSRYHVDRLLAIKQFRDSAMLTLDKIRLLLQDMTNDEIRHVAGGGYFKVVDTDTDTDADAVPVATPVSARHSTVEANAATEGKDSPLDRLVAGLDELAGRASKPSVVQDNQWHEIDITPDLRLSIRGAYSQMELAKFKRIAEQIRYLLSGIEEGE